MQQVVLKPVSSFEKIVREWRASLDLVTACALRNALRKYSDDRRDWAIPPKELRQGPN